MTVEGLDPARFDLQEASGVRWNEAATVAGELRGDTFTATGPGSGG